MAVASQSRVHWHETVENPLAMEFLNHTDPDNADTDGDMISDNLEITSYTNTKDLEYSPVVTDNIGPGLNVNIWRTFAGAGWADMKITVSASDDSGLAYLKLEIVERSIMGGEQTIVEKKLEYWDNNIWSNSVKVASIENVEFTIYASASYDIYVEACDHNGNFAEYHNHWTGIVEAIVKGLKEIKNTIKDALNFLKNSVLNNFKDMIRPHLPTSKEPHTLKTMVRSPTSEESPEIWATTHMWGWIGAVGYTMPFQASFIISVDDVTDGVLAVSAEEGVDLYKQGEQLGWDTATVYMEIVSVIGLIESILLGLAAGLSSGFWAGVVVAEIVELISLGIDLYLLYLAGKISLPSLGG